MNHLFLSLSSIFKACLASPFWMCLMFLALFILAVCVAALPFVLAFSFASSEPNREVVDGPTGTNAYVPDASAAVVVVTTCL